MQTGLLNKKQTRLMIICSLEPLVFTFVFRELYCEISVNPFFSSLYEHLYTLVFFGFHEEKRAAPVV
jgi:hypothetical protein